MLDPQAYGEGLGLHMDLLFRKLKEQLPRTVAHRQDYRLGFYLLTVGKNQPQKPPVPADEPGDTAAETHLAAAASDPFPDSPHNLS